MNVRDLVQRETGLNLTETTVERAVHERMASRSLADRQAYTRLLDGEELAALIELVVVPESWLFRDAEAFAAATAFVQRRLAERPAQRLRILSLPCAGGEEPYSIAMALHDAGVAPSACEIEGVDLSAVAVARARSGRFTRNAFRGQELAFRERHFTFTNGLYQIDEQIRRRVTFTQGNMFTLADGANAGRYDVLFCRNLLIYFDDATVARAVATLRTLLADDGILFVGYSEVSACCRHGLAQLATARAFALEKRTRVEDASGRGLAPRALPPRPAVRRAPVLAPAAAPAPVPLRPVPARAPATPAQSAAELLAEAQRLADHGQYRAAEAACQALLKADSACADAYFILGMVSECEHRRAAADAYWRRCVYLQPDHYDALCHLALLAEEAGDVQGAAAFKARAARVFGRRQTDRSASR
jgi:chemotaxis protein methyltransferase WspC